jgi:restriction system protein
MSKKINNGPEFIRFFKPLLEVLQSLGGSGNSSEVTDLVIEKMKIPEEELEVVLKSGAPRIKNQIHFSRMYLVNSGLIDSSKRGIWSLTEKGLTAQIKNKAEALSIFNVVQKKFINKQQVEAETKQESISNNEDEIDFEENHRDELIKILQEISPNGFERLCQRLLRESGFKKVMVTGKSGDGGIDGEGILEINPLLSFKVLFQSKRYQGAVSSSQVRDFRGAMTGRADKGIIITTGRFTQNAKKEAIRDGAPPIELVDGEAILDLFERNEIGLTPKIVYEIDYDFFEEFK